MSRRISLWIIKSGHDKKFQNVNLQYNSLKGYQEATARREITKKQQFRDESESESPSCSKESYEIDSSGEPPAVNARAKVMSQVITEVGPSLPHSDEGGEKTEADDDDPPNDNKEEGENADEESGEQESDSEPSTVPNASIQEEPKIQTGALNEVPELRRLFEKYIVHWIVETPGRYSGDMVCEFYENYYSTMEKNAPTRQAVKKEWCYTWFNQSIPVDISERTISRFLYDSSYEAPVLTLEYDYQMEVLERVKKLSIEDKLMHIQ
ncbi:hypothetical protein HAX54_022629 [Datura stramonium]|uniref:Uncharacterized protein n=1 Tax=Datura stramonium TaxID=4076 RepID=A0ABS8UWQ5_DATST|nr:hypothetical protein [Datura stramonium]